MVVVRTSKRASMWEGGAVESRDVEWSGREVK